MDSKLFFDPKVVALVLEYAEERNRYNEFGGRVVPETFEKWYEEKVESNKRAEKAAQVKELEADLDAVMEKAKKYGLEIEAGLIGNNGRDVVYWLCVANIAY